MHGISFGAAALPYSFGPSRPGAAHGLSANQAGDHAIARSGCGQNQNASRYSLGGILSNLSSSISSLRSQLESLSTSRDLPTDSPAVGSGDFSVSAMGAQIINKQRGELQIHTQDGDVVTLKFSSKVGVSIEGQQLSDGTSTLTSTSLDMSSRSRIAVSVEGDLSDAELAAINDLVDKVGELTNEFFSGDMASVLAQAMSLSYDTSQLADYSLDLSLKQSVRTYAYAMQWSPPITIDTSQANNEATSPAAATEEPAAADAAVAAPATTASVATPETAESSTPAVPVSTDAAPTGSDSTATQIVAQFVASVRSSLRMTASDASLGMSYEFKTKLLISSITHSAPADAAPSPATLEYLEEQLGSAA